MNSKKKLSSLNSSSESDFSCHSGENSGAFYSIKTKTPKAKQNQKLSTALRNNLLRRKNQANQNKSIQ